jgi:hypothetical protein
MASFFMATRVLKLGSHSSYIFAGVCAGLAAATKYPAGLVILSLIAAHYLQEQRQHSVALFYGVFASFITFIVANPPHLMASCEFFEGFIKDGSWHTVAGGDDRATLAVIENIYQATGPALSVLLVLSAVYAIYLVSQKKHLREFLLLASMISPFLALLFSAHFNTMRYAMPVIPPLMISVGKMLDDLISLRKPSFRRAGIAVGALTLFLSMAYTVVADLEIVHDSRTMAAAWIQRHVPSGATVEATTYSVDSPGGAGYGAAVRKEGVKVRFRPHVHNAALVDWVAAVQESPLYRALYPVFVSYASAAESVGLCSGERPYYQGWYERHLREVKEGQVSFDETMAGLEIRAPDFVVASNFYYDTFTKDGSSPERKFFDQLLSGSSSYLKVAEFHYTALPFSPLDPQPEFFNPKISVFQRAGRP